MKVKMELGGKRSRQQLERETDETIQQIVAKAKVVPIVQKKSTQHTTKKLEPDFFRLRPIFIKRNLGQDRARVNKKPYRRPTEPEEQIEAPATVAPPPPLPLHHTEYESSEQKEAAALKEEFEEHSQLERPTCNSFFWHHRSFPHMYNN